MTPGPTITSQSNEAEIDRNNLKIIILGVLGMGMSALSASLFLRVLSVLQLSYFFLWVGAVIAFVTLVVLETIFIKSRGKLQAIMFFQGLAPAVVLSEYLFPEIVLPIFVGLFVCSFFLMIGASRGWQILANSLSIKFSFVARNTISKAITGILIFSSLLAFTYYFIAGNFTEALGRSVTYEVLASSESMIHLWFPGVHFTDSSRSFFEKIARTQLQKISLEEIAKNQAISKFHQLSEQQKEKIVAEMGEKIRAATEKSLGGTFAPQEEVRSAIFSALKKMIGDIQERTGNIFPIVVAVFLFAVMKGIFSFFHWLIIGISFLVYKFLIITGFAHTSLENRSREFVLLS